MALIQNAVRIIDEDIYLVSTSVDDLNTFVFNDGLKLSVAGGMEFARRADDYIKLNYEGRYTEWILTDDDPFYWIAERLLAPTPSGWRPIRELDFSNLYQLSDRGDVFQSKVASHWLKIKSSV